VPVADRDEHGVDRLTAPVFTSFEESWSWFTAGGELVSEADKRAAWTRGRAQFLGFSAPVADAAVIESVREAQDGLADIDGLLFAPEEQLHISIRGVGFQVIEKRRDDDVLRQDVPRIAARATPIVAATRQIAVTVGPVNVFPDAVVLEVRDDGSLADLRSRLGALSGPDAFGFGDEVYLPHVTIATFASASVAGELRERLPPLRGRAAVASGVRRIELVRAWFTGIDDGEETEVDVVHSYLLKAV
jgi:2'-5' RNA ligase